MGVSGDDAREARRRWFGGGTLRLQLPGRRSKEKTVMDEGKEDMQHDWLWLPMKVQEQPETDILMFGP